MRHCVASYHDEIMSGESCIYKVLYPQRATLELTRDDNGHLKINQLRLPRNKSPSKKSMTFIQKWFGFETSRKKSSLSY